MSWASGAWRTSRAATSEPSKPQKIAKSPWLKVNFKCYNKAVENRSVPARPGSAHRHRRQLLWKRSYRPLGAFAPAFAHYNDDVLFGENWNDDAIDLKTRSILTVVALMSSGVTDSSLKYHLQNAKNHGVTQKEIAAIITHVAFYVGWPKGWAVFNMAKEIWAVEPEDDSARAKHQASMVFPIGEPNVAYAKYFIGQSYLAPISTQQVGIHNVTFEPGCRNNWHIHHAKTGGGQILICVAGRGYYQEEGKPAVELNPGDCINIPAEVKHWHGAAPDSWFSHLAVEVPGTECSNEWCEPITDEEYSKLK